MAISNIMHFARCCGSFIKFVFKMDVSFSIDKDLTADIVLASVYPSLSHYQESMRVIESH